MKMEAVATLQHFHKKEKNRKRENQLGERYFSHSFKKLEGREWKKVKKL